VAYTNQIDLTITGNSEASDGILFLRLCKSDAVLDGIVSLALDGCENWPIDVAFSFDGGSTFVPFIRFEVVPGHLVFIIPGDYSSDKTLTVFWGDASAPDYNDDSLADFVARDNMFHQFSPISAPLTAVVPYATRNNYGFYSSTGMACFFEEGTGDYVSVVPYGAYFRVYVNSSYASYYHDDTNDVQTVRAFFLKLDGSNAILEWTPQLGVDLTSISKACDYASIDRVEFPMTYRLQAICGGVAIFSGLKKQVYVNEAEYYKPPKFPPPGEFQHLPISEAGTQRWVFSGYVTEGGEPATNDVILYHHQTGFVTKTKSRPSDGYWRIALPRLVFTDPFQQLKPFIYVDRAFAVFCHDKEQVYNAKIYDHITPALEIGE